MCSPFPQYPPPVPHHDIAMRAELLMSGAGWQVMQALLVSKARESQIPNSSHLYRVVSHDSSSVLLVHRLAPAIRQRVSAVPQLL